MTVVSFILFKNSNNLPDEDFSQLDEIFNDINLDFDDDIDQDFADESSCEDEENNFYEDFEEDDEVDLERAAKEYVIIFCIYVI